MSATGEPSFRESVDLMFNRAVALMDLGPGLEQKIRVCNSTYTVRFGVRLRGKIDYSPIGFQLLPQAFTLRQLQDVHEVVRGESVNKDSFRRRMLATGQLEATGEHERDVTWRPAELYRVVRRSAV
jgi:hypothetical protein